MKTTIQTKLRALATLATKVADFLDTLQVPDRKVSIVVTPVVIRVRHLKSGTYVAQVRRADNNAWIWSSSYKQYATDAVDEARTHIARNRLPLQQIFWS